MLNGIDLEGREIYFNSPEPVSCTGWFKYGRDWFLCKQNGNSAGHISITLYLLILSFSKRSDSKTKHIYINGAFIRKLLHQQ